MSAVLVYRALDEAGAALLDQLEETPGLESRRMEFDQREFHLLGPNAGEQGIEPLLARQDPDWEQHVQRVTPRQ